MRPECLIPSFRHDHEKVCREMSRRVVMEVPTARTILRRDDGGTAREDTGGRMIRWRGACILQAVGPPLCFPAHLRSPETCPSWPGGTVPERALRRCSGQAPTERRNRVVVGRRLLEHAAFREHVLDWSACAGQEPSASRLVVPYPAVIAIFERAVPSMRPGIERPPGRQGLPVHLHGDARRDGTPYLP